MSTPPRVVTPRIDRGFIEIGPRADTTTLGTLLRAIYRTRTGSTVCWVRSLPVAAVDRMLDAAVRDVGIWSPGVRYLLAEDLDAVARQAAGSGMCVATCPELISHPVLSGTRIFSPGEALRFLGADPLASAGSPREVAPRSGRRACSWKRADLPIN
mgnify:CR=1 FL=1